MALSHTSLDSESSRSATSSSSGSYTPVTSNSYISDSVSVYDITDTKDNPPFGSSGIVPFNDRSMEARDARLANALYSLDEDLPQNIDDSIKNFLMAHLNSTPSGLGRMEFLVDENYLEYKSNLATKRALEKKLPRSKGRRSDNSIEALKNLAISTPAALDYFQSLALEGYVEYKNNLTTKRAHEKELPKSKDRRFPQ